MIRLILVGANNPEVARQARAVMHSQEIQVLGFLDNDPSKHKTAFQGFRVFGGFEQLPEWVGTDVQFVNVITRDTRTRHETTRAMVGAGAKLGQFIHPAVNLADVQLGYGSYLQEYAIVQAGVRLGNNCSISAGA